MSTITPNHGPARAAENASLNDFLRLSNGDVLPIFLGNTNEDRVEWVHGRVEKDLVFGAVRLESGLSLPIDCYLENNGCGLSFETYGTEASKSILSEDMSGSVFLSTPLPSQLPKRWRPSESGPRYGTFASREKKSIEDFTEHLKSLGFCEGPSWRSGGFDVRLPIWESSWRKQSCDVNIFLRRERQGLLKATSFFISVTDHSNRPTWKRGTRLIAKDGISLTEAVQVMSSGIDLAWARSR